jgi:hypothetical protein
MGIRDTIERCRGLGKAFNPITALRGFKLLGKYLKTLAITRSRRLCAI